MVDAPPQQRVEHRVQAVRVRRQLIAHAQRCGLSTRRLTRPSACNWRNWARSTLAVTAASPRFSSPKPCGPSRQPLQDHRLPAAADHRNRRIQAGTPPVRDNCPAVGPRRHSVMGTSRCPLVRRAIPSLHSADGVRIQALSCHCPGDEYRKRRLDSTARSSIARASACRPGGITSTVAA